MFKLRPGCIHCGHPFDKHDTRFHYREGWRVHRECVVNVDTKGHQLKGCTGCYVRKVRDHDIVLEQRPYGAGDSGSAVG